MPLLRSGHRAHPRRRSAELTRIGARPAADLRGSGGASLGQSQSAFDGLSAIARGRAASFARRRGSDGLPFCYHFGMSKQIAVRLPDELVDFVDEIVDSGTARSRAIVVTRALERERRRALAERDARILARTGPDPELAGLAEHAAGLPRDIA
jgi:Arc/MetJ-type ribon-helix-helix transcriptional regulator